MELLHALLTELTLGVSRQHQNLTLTPLLRAVSGMPDYLTLDEALARGEVRITEVSDAGSVPELRLSNRAAQAVLLLDGEELVGAKQNRILNLTLLAPALSDLVLPVSCVEAGRWSRAEDAFSSEGRTMFWSARARKADHVTDSLRSEGRRTSRQGEVWREIEEKSARMGSASPTEAMDCLYEDHQGMADEYTAALLPTEPNEVGAVFSINGKVHGLEVFDFNDTLRKVLPKLVVSYALDAIEALPHATEPPVAPDAAGFLREVGDSHLTPHPSVGEGTDLRLSGDRLSGGALLARERVMHLCAFRLTHPAPREGDVSARMTRPSRRRRP